MAKALEIRRGSLVPTERRTEPAEWARWRRGSIGAKGDGPVAATVQVPELPAPVEDTSFGASVEIRGGERR